MINVLQCCILKLLLHSVNSVPILYRTGNRQSAILLSFVASSSLLPCGLQSMHPRMPCYISPYVVYNVYDRMAILPVYMFDLFLFLTGNAKKRLKLFWKITLQFFNRTNIDISNHRKKCQISLHVCTVPKIFHMTMFAICSWTKKHSRLKFSVCYCYSWITFRILWNFPASVGRNNGSSPLKSHTFFSVKTWSGLVLKLCSNITSKSATWGAEAFNKYLNLDLIRLVYSCIHLRTFHSGTVQLSYV